MKARIYLPTRTPMQSGEANTHKWVLEFTPTAPLYIEPLMGWSGMTDTTQEIQLRFDSEAAAMDYARRNGIEFNAKQPNKKIRKPKSYAANFAFNKVQS